MYIIYKIYKFYTYVDRERVLWLIELELITTEKSKFIFPLKTI